MDTDLPATVRFFLSHRVAAGLSPASIAFYRSQLKPFAAYCSSRCLRITDLSSDRLIDYLQYRRANGRSTRMLFSEFTAIHALLTWALADKRAKVGVLDNVRWPKTPTSMIESFSFEDVQRLLQAASQGREPQRDRAIILVMADTGVRASELCGVKDSDVRDNRMKVLGKGSKERWVPLAALTLDAIREWRQHRPKGVHTLFVTRYRTAFTRDSLYALFKRLGERGGVTDARCSPHTMRHTTATQWIRMGGDLKNLQRLLGHTDYRQTLRYVDSASDLEVEKAHRRVGFVRRLEA